MKSHLPKTQPLVSRFYRTGTLIFLSVSLVLAGTITAFALQKTTITITLVQRRVSTDINLTVNEDSENSDNLKGVILTAASEDTRTVDVETDGPTVEDYSSGTVTIKSTWTKSQPLAAGTRLKASSNGLIYRTTKRVDVPPGGSVNVDVTCDQKGAIGNIEPDRFTIVALWPGLQDDIYGLNTNTFSGGTRTSGELTQATLDEAAKSLLADLTTTATGKLTVPPGLSLIGDPVLLSSSTAANATAGASVSSFTIRGTVSISSVAVDASDLTKRGHTALQTKLSSSEQLLSIETSPDVAIKNLSPKSKTATLTATFHGLAQLMSTQSQFSASHFTGKRRADIITELKGVSGVQDIDVAISPPWSSRAPNRASRISVVIRTAE